MAQFDLGNLESPLSGTALINDFLEPWRDALHTTHMGGARPSYAVAGIQWINNTTNPWILNVFDGANDISLGTIDTATNKFTPFNAAQLAENNTFTGTNTFENLIVNSGLNADALTIESASPQLTFQDTSFAATINGNSGNLFFDTSSVNRDPVFQAAGVEQARINMNDGAYIGGGISMDGGVNTLDHYETGSWTPVLQGATTEGTTTYTVNEGIFIRIGDFVLAQARIVWTAATGTGQAEIGGLPFDARAGTVNRVPLNIGYSNGLELPAGEYLGGYIEPNTDYIRLLSGGDTGLDNFLDLQSEITPSGSIYFSVCYYQD